MRNLVVVLMFVAGCAQTPDLDQNISNASLGADYPTLIALDGQDLFASDTGGQDVIAELDARTASLWSRIGTLFN